MGIHFTPVATTGCGFGERTKGENAIIALTKIAMRNRMRLGVSDEAAPEAASTLAIKTVAVSRKERRDYCRRIPNA
jgi:hypothetical protein